jgi:hypothetical protein
MWITLPLLQGMVKRLADASEKFAVASFAIGAYQGNEEAGAAGLAFLLVTSLILTKGGEK